MGKLLDPPKKESLDAATFSLEKLGAIENQNETYAVTPLGMHLAGIPAPPIIGKRKWLHLSRPQLIDCFVSSCYGCNTGL